MTDNDLYTPSIYLIEVGNSLKLSITESTVNKMSETEIDLIFIQMGIASTVNKDPYFCFRYLGFFLKTNKDKYFINYLAIKYTELFIHIELMEEIYERFEHMLTDESKSILNFYSLTYYNINSEIETMNFKPDEELFKVINSSIIYCSPDDVD